MFQARKAGLAFEVEGTLEIDFAGEMAVFKGVEGFRVAVFERLLGFLLTHYCGAPCDFLI